MQFEKCKLSEGCCLSYLPLYLQNSEQYLIHGLFKQPIETYFILEYYNNNNNNKVVA